MTPEDRVRKAAITLIKALLVLKPVDRAKLVLDIIQKLCRYTEDGLEYGE